MPRRWSVPVALIGPPALSALILRLAWPRGLRLAALPGALLRTPPEQGLPLLLALGLCAMAAWMCLTVALAVLSRWPSAIGHGAGRVLERITPLALRRLLEVALGATTVLSSTVGAAQAAGPVTTVHVTAQQVTARHVTAQQVTAQQVTAQGPSAVHAPGQVAVVTGLDRPATAAVAPGPVTSTPDLDRPAASADPARGLGLVTSVATRPRAPQANPPVVVVRTGDSLWRIAARALPPGATAQEIESAWHRWYAANRSVVGPDPGLLQPGQRLQAPQN